MAVVRRPPGLLAALVVEVRRAIAAVTLARVGGRCEDRGMSDSVDTRPRAVQYAEDAYESLRAINHLRLYPTPAPVLYSVLGDLKSVGSMLGEALGNLGVGLTGSLEVYDVREDDGGDPVARAADAVAHMTRAQELARQIYAELDAAQSAIARQSFSPKA